jgi:hypothetical protein
MASPIATLVLVDWTKAQRNEAFHAVVAGKLDPAACDVNFGDYGLRISHKPTGSYYEAFLDAQRSLLDVERDWNVNRWLGTDPQTQNRVGMGWPELMRDIGIWAKDVIEWIDTPDLWEIRQSWRSLSDAEYDGTANTPFTPEERATVSHQLTAIREQIKMTYDLTAAQEAKIDARFEEAKKASERLGRKDWILLFGGSVFSLILADVITPDIAQHILMIAVRGLEHLFLSGPPPVRGILGAGGD